MADQRITASYSSRYIPSPVRNKTLLLDCTTSGRGIMMLGFLCGMGLIRWRRKIINIPLLYILEIVG